MNSKLLVLIFSIGSLLIANAQTKLASGKQPQITVDTKGMVRLVYGDKNNIYFSTSIDNGKTFDSPVLVGKFPTCTSE